MEEAVNYIGPSQLIGLGGTDTFVDVRAKQFNDAAGIWGLTILNKGRGQENVHYARMSGAYAAKLIQYWRSEASRYYKRGINEALNNIFGSEAHRLSWERAVDTLNGPAASTYLSQALFMGAAVLPDESTKAIWDLVDPVAIGLGAVRDTPSQWDMIVASVVESARDLAATKPFQVALDIVTAAKWLGIGLIAYVGYDALRKR
jgi:hypothetical protein